MRSLLLALLFLSQSAFAQLSGYSYRKLITIDNTGNPEALSDHPVRVDLSTANFDFSLAQADGDDIRFGTSVNNLFPFYTQSYNGTSSAVIYVRINHCAAFSSCTLNMYYGNAGATSVSNWTNTMQRISLSPSGGDTKYFFGFNEGSGATITNAGSVGGAVSIAGTTPTWQSTNTYLQSGTTPRFNGTNNYMVLPTLLDAWPTAGEISVSFIVRTLPTGGDQIGLFEKFNRIGTSFPDLGSKFNAVLIEQGGGVYVRIQNFISTAVSPAHFNNYATYVASDINSINITVGTSHKLSVVWNEGSLAFYVDGLIAGRAVASQNFWHEDGHGSDFTIGALRSQTTGSIVTYSNIEFNDFRFTDYTSGQPPRLPQIEAEHSQLKFIQKDIRTKFSVTRYVTSSNVLHRQSTLGLIDGRLQTAADAANPRYDAAPLEPEIMFDADDGKFKMWYNDYGGLTAPAVIFYYRESSTYLGLSTATPVLATVVGGKQVQRPTIYKEAGVYHLFYNNRIQAGGSFMMPVYHQTSTDGINFSSETTALAVPGSNFGSHNGFENAGGSKMGSTYYMTIEGQYNNGSLTGTITATTISTAVVGLGTLFTTELKAGLPIYNSSGTSVIGTIASITNDTNLVLTANATNAITGAAYSEGFHNKIGLATSSTIGGTYTVSGTTPIPTFDDDQDSGGATILKVGGIDYIAYHARRHPILAGQVLYGEMQVISTADYVTFNHYTGGYDEIVGRCFDEAYSRDQFADVSWITDGTKTYLAYSGNRNDGNQNFFGTISLAEFNGTTAQLVHDFSVTVSNPRILIVHP